jgi:rubrerythrin
MEKVMLVANGEVKWFNRASGPDTAELRCSKCGYGIMVSGEPPMCPMCRSSAWQASDVGLTSRQGGRAGP